ncbi:MAG TPA: hypothetical protein ENM98_01720 [Halothiobacillaceae bacterium]|nr:hypothetical protein [Halothiobacillaceae bacterium]
MNQSWRPGASLATLRKRARINQLLRTVSEQRGWLEIDPPVIIDADAFESGIELIHTYDALNACANSLHSSPELALKRVLAAYPQLPGVYSLGPVFRAGESGRLHNPQFTLFEFYQTQVDLSQIIETTLDLILTVTSDQKAKTPPIVRWDYAELLAEYCQLSADQVYHAPATELAKTGKRLGINVSADIALNRDDWLNLLLTHIVEPTFPGEQLTLITGFPESQAAMAKTQYDSIAGMRIERACRFELYGGQMELANGYQELTCPKRQRARLSATQKPPSTHKTSNQSLNRFMSALEHGLPESCGVALGVERLLLWLSGNQHIDAVMAFSHNRR